MTSSSLINLSSDSHSSNWGLSQLQTVGLYQGSPPGFHYFTSWTKDGTWRDSNPRIRDIFRPPPRRGLHWHVLYRLSYRSELDHYLMSWTKGRIQRVGFEPTKRNGLQYEYLKYLLVAISARHHQFRHTTKPANRSSPLTTRTTLLKFGFHF